MTDQHVPVLLAESLETADLKPGDRVLDCTLGLGGHAFEFCMRIGQGSFTGIDADEANIALAQQKLADVTPTTTFIHDNFGNVATCTAGEFDFIFADLGVSSPHFDDPSRGFTFRQDAPLDMRYDRTQGQTARELLTTISEYDLMDILRQYGELNHPAKLARLLCHQPPETTFALRDAVESIFGRQAKSLLPQVFQALRIAVNQELQVLESLLESAPLKLAPGGRFVVLSYHSLEDRLVKQAFRRLSEPHRDDFTGAVIKSAGFSLLNKKPIKASDEEIDRNPRARSVCLRGLVRSR